MVQDFDVKSFLSNIKATKPPYCCPFDGCHKIYKTYIGMRFHVYNFDHINSRGVVSPDDKQSSKKRRQWHRRQSSGRSPSPPQFLRTSTTDASRFQATEYPQFVMFGSYRTDAESAEFDSDGIKLTNVSPNNPNTKFKYHIMIPFIEMKEMLYCFESNMNVVFIKPTKESNDKVRDCMYLGNESKNGLKFDVNSIDEREQQLIVVFKVLSQEFIGKLESIAMNSNPGLSFSNINIDKAKYLLNRVQSRIVDNRTAIIQKLLPTNRLNSKSDSHKEQTIYPMPYIPKRMTRSYTRNSNVSHNGIEMETSKAPKRQKTKQKSKNNNNTNSEHKQKSQSEALIQSTNAPEVSESLNQNFGPKPECIVIDDYNDDNENDKMTKCSQNENSIDMIESILSNNENVLNNEINPQNPSVGQQTTDGNASTSAQTESNQLISPEISQSFSWTGIPKFLLFGTFRTEANTVEFNSVGLKFCRCCANNPNIKTKYQITIPFKEITELLYCFEPSMSVLFIKPTKESNDTVQESLYLGNQSKNGLMFDVNSEDLREHHIIVLMKESFGPEFSAQLESVAKKCNPELRIWKINVNKAEYMLQRVESRANC